MIKPLKTITSYAGLARFLAECETGDDGHTLVIVREVVKHPDIPSPYAFTPSWPTNRWNGQEIVIREVSHRRYLVFDASGMATASE